MTSNNFIASIVEVYGCTTVNNDTLIFYNLFDIESNKKYVMIIEEIYSKNDYTSEKYISIYQYKNIPKFLKNIYIYCIKNKSYICEYSELQYLYGPTINSQTIDFISILIDFIPHKSYQFTLGECKERHDWYNELNDIIAD